MLVQSDHRSTKPGVPCSNHGGRATDGNRRGKAANWPPTPAQIARFALDVDASAGPNACHIWQGRGIDAPRFALQLKLGRALLPSETVAAQFACVAGCCNQRHLAAFDYRAARIALGMTPAEADAATARARRLGKRVARGELSMQRAAELLDVTSLVAVAVDGRAS